MEMEMEMDAMDYQSFAGQPQPQPHPSFAASASTGQTHSPQHPHPHPHLYAADPHARLQHQQSQQHQHQHSPSFPYAAANAQQHQQPMMQGQLHRAAALQQQHPQQQHPQQQHPHPQQLSQQSPYSPAPSFALASTPTHQQFAHNRQTASPAASTPGNPYAPPHAHSLSQHSQQSPSPLGSSAAAAASTAQLSAAMTAVKPDPALHTPLKTVPPSPVSPVAHARNQERMATLLDINNLLISEACDLQTQGKGGQIGPPEGDKAQPSKEYIDYVRRLQANLSYLAQNAEKNPKPGQPIQPGPAIMHAPSSHDELAKLYLKLQGLFPGWKGAQPGAAKQSPGPQRLNSTSSLSQLPLQSQPQSQSQPQPLGSAGLQSNWGQNAMQAMQNMQQAQAKAEP